MTPRQPCTQFPSTIDVSHPPKLMSLTTSALPFRDSHRQDWDYVPSLENVLLTMWFTLLDTSTQFSIWRSGPNQTPSSVIEPSVQCRTTLSGGIHLSLQVPRCKPTDFRRLIFTPVTVSYSLIALPILCRLSISVTMNIILIYLVNIHSTLQKEITNSKSKFQIHDIKEFCKILQIKYMVSGLFLCI